MDREDIEVLLRKSGEVHKGTMKLIKKLNPTYVNDYHVLHELITRVLENDTNRRRLEDYTNRRRRLEE